VAGFAVIASTLFAGSVALAASPQPVSVDANAVRAARSHIAISTDRSSDSNAIELAAEASTNRARGNGNLQPLRHNDTLKRIAEAYARQMAAGTFFSHVDPQGKSISDRAQQGGYDYREIGENLAKLLIHDAQNVVSYAVDGWMSSPGHRANIMNADYDEIGIGVAQDASGQYYFCQLLGRRDD
jgi:uncharacterized protein YkwD